MADDNKKTMVLNTLLLVFCVVIICFFCFMPTKKLDELDTYKVIFDSNGGSAIAAIEIEEGKEIGQPDDPVKEGYVFVGWMLGDELYDFSKGVAKDITLTAGWKKLDPEKVYYTVSFDTDGGTTIGNQVIEAGDVAVMPSEPIKNGYTFTGWQLDGAQYDFDSPVNSNVTIMAIWKENEKPTEPEDPNKTYTVRFDANGGQLGSGCGNQTVKTGTKASNSCQVTRSGYTFTGWSPAITRNITADTTFRAQWKQNSSGNQGSNQGGTTTVTQYRVNFYYNGGTGNCPSLTVAKGSTANLGSCIPTKKYYTLAGWTNGSANYATGSNVTINSNTDLTARWTLNTFVATCNAKGLGSLNPQCVISVSDNKGNAYTGSYTVYSNGGTYLGTFSNGSMVAVRKNGAYTVKFTIDGQNVEIKNGTVVE